MGYEAVLTEQFTATHSLGEIRPERHTHDWVVKVTVAAETLEEPGFIINFYELQPLVKNALPHGKHLNEVFDFMPTAENLAKHFYEQLKPQLPQLKSVSVGEFESFLCTFQSTQ